jgi:hypothetical protein
LPAAPETVALYLTDRAATLKTSSLARRLTTINRAHQAAGQPSPATMQNAIVSEVWKGIKRKKGTSQQGKKPFLTPDLRRIIAELPPDLQGLRDRALLLVGFAGRLSKIGTGRAAGRGSGNHAGRAHRAARQIEDRSGRAGKKVALPYGSDPQTCPVRTLDAWLDQAGITAGPCFRAIDRGGAVGGRALHADSVGYLVKRAAARAGLETAEYAGHSLRAGLATQAAMNGASESGHHEADRAPVAGHRKEIHPRGSLFRDNAAAKLGL